MRYQPKVTIIIPVYNGCNFLAEAIDAALTQTYDNCEIIVVNDGSKDDGASERIALSYGERIIYYSKDNGGVSSALNYAFERMTGEWFSWLSHDDLYYPEKIEKQVAFLNELIEKNPSVNLNKITIRCATESIDKEGKVIRVPSYRNVPLHEEPIDTIINNIYSYRLSGCSFLLPSACIADVGLFDESIRTVSDVEYWYRLLFSGYEFYCLSDDILVKNRSHGKQVGKTKISLFDQELNDLHIKIADRLLAQNGDKELTKRVYLGVISRKMKRAAAYIFDTYVRHRVPAFERYVVLLAKRVLYNLKGTIRDIARYIYRRINVR